MQFCAPLVLCAVFVTLTQLCHGQPNPFTFGNFPPIETPQSAADAPFSFSATGSQFMPSGGMQEPQQAFLDLLAPMQTPLFPSNLMMIKNKLCELINSNQLDVGPVMEYLVKFQHLDQFDLMIVALLALRDTLPADCPLRQELGQLIVHAIFKRCQARIVVSGERQVMPMPLPAPAPIAVPLPPLPLPMPLPMPMPVPLPMPLPGPGPLEPQAPPLSCETIMSILKYFQGLFEQFSCQQCSMGGNVVPLAGNPFTFTKRNIQQAHKRRSINLTRSNLLEKPKMYGQAKSEPVSYASLVDILPQPQNEMEKLKYNQVKSFLNGNQVANFMKDVTSTDYNNKQKLLNLVYQKVAASNVDASTKEAFNFYFNKNHTTVTRSTASFDYSTLIDLIPQPVDAEEKEKFEIVQSFFNRKDLHKYLKHIDASVYTDKKLLLKSVLKALIASKLDKKTTDAFTYYLNYQESLTALELYTKKEITKHFELTKIFIDTLDIESLSNEAKLAFKKFFKFISNITKEQIKGFDTWSEVKTKGEFMKALFKYLMEQSFVPPDVKDAITKLEPLVKMVGRGAAPP